LPDIADFGKKAPGKLDTLEFISKFGMEHGARVPGLKSISQFFARKFLAMQAW